MSNCTDLERMKNIIRFYLEREFGKHVVDEDKFKDLSNISLAYTEDSYYGVYPMQVYANLIEPSIVYTIGEEPIQVESYKSLKEMADCYCYDNEEQYNLLDFCELISVCDNYFELNRDCYPVPSFDEVNA